MHFLRGEELVKQQQLIIEIEQMMRWLDRVPIREMEQLNAINKIRLDRWIEWSHNNPTEYNSTMNKLENTIMTNAKEVARNRITPTIVDNIIANILPRLDTFYKQLTEGENFMTVTFTLQGGNVSFKKLNTGDIILASQFVEPPEVDNTPEPKEKSIMDYFTSPKVNPVKVSEPRVYSPNKSQVEHIKNVVTDFYKIQGYTFFMDGCAGPVHQKFVADLPI